MELPTAGRDDRQALRLRLSASLPAGLAGVEALPEVKPAKGLRWQRPLTALTGLKGLSAARATRQPPSAVMCVIVTCIAFDALIAIFLLVRP
jgi:hypothetical protein